MADGSFCRVHCRVRAETKLGQSVAIAMASSDSFDRNSVIEMLVTTPDAYPVWYTKAPLVVPGAQTAYYRYCIVEAGALAAFEGPTSQPRVIHASGSSSGDPSTSAGAEQAHMDIVLEDTFSPAEAESTDGTAAPERDLLQKLTDLRKTEVCRGGCAACAFFL